MYTAPLARWRAAPVEQRLAQGGLMQCMQRRGRKILREPAAVCTVQDWIYSQLYGVSRSMTSRLPDQSWLRTRLG